MDRPGLPDIRALTEDPTVDRPMRAWRVLQASIAIAGLLLCWGIAFVAWEMRRDVTHPDLAYAMLALAVWAAPTFAVVRAWRRDSAGLAAMVAIMAPMICWAVIAIFHGVARNLDGMPII